MENVLQVVVLEDEQGTFDFDILDETWIDTLLERICRDEGNGKVSENFNDDKEEQPLEENKAVDHKQ